MKQDVSLRKIGDSYYLLIPPELLKWLGLREGSDTVEVQDEEGKHGRFASFWAKKGK